MYKRTVLKLIFFFLCFYGKSSFSQILGGGTTFATAVIFNQSWLVGCPAGGTSLCNTSGCEPTTAMDACGTAPACASGTTGSDVWFKFFAQSATATITVNPTSAFDIAIQAFSGSTCAGLTDIGCVDAQGNNQPETITLTGLTAGTLYYFRIFGATTNNSARTGTYHFCGSTGLGSAPLPVSVSALYLQTKDNRQCLSWLADGEKDIEKYEVEYSNDGINFSTVGAVAASNDPLQHTYRYCDAAARTRGLYRIRIVEKNASFKFSYSVRVQSNQSSVVQLYPNPATDMIQFDLPAAEKSISYSISNAFGQIVQSGKLSESRTINVHTLKHGVYFVRLYGEHITQTIGFEKK